VNTQLTPLELSAVLDALDTRIEKVAEYLTAKDGAALVPPADTLRVAYRDRLIVLRRAREKIMLGGL